MIQVQQDYIVNKARAALRALGDNAAAVASSLQEKGFRGIPLDNRYCPIASYLRAQDLVAGPVSVDQDHILLIVPGYPARELEFRTPDPISEFVSQFDNGGFPKLVENGT